MAGLVTETFTSNGTCTIPINSRNVTITVAGARGAAGGNGGSAGGFGAKGTFKYKVNYVARSLDIVIGAVGSGTTGGASNIASGGNGGTGIYRTITYGTDEQSLYAGTKCTGDGGCGWLWQYVCIPNGYTKRYNCNVNAFGNCSPGKGPDTTVTCYKDVPTSSNNDTESNGGGGGGATGIPGLIIAAGGGGSQGGPTVTAGADGSGFQSSSEYSTATNGTSQGDNGFSPGLGGTGGGGTGGNSYYNSSLLEQIGLSILYSGDPYIEVTYDIVDPEINSFSASPNPQTSGTVGNPSSLSALAWTTTFAQSVSINQSIGVVELNETSYPIDTGLQSVAGSNSPATKAYTLSACIGTNCVTQTVIVSVFNDNTPNDFTIPNQIDKNPNEVVIINVGNITGIDMKTAVTSLSGECDFSINDNLYSGSQIIESGQSLKIRTFALALNTSELGLVNTKTCQIKVGTLIKTFTVSTRVPVVAEIFDFANAKNEWPHPKIDTTANPTFPYIETVPAITMDDIETQVRIKTNNGNTQVRVKSPGQSYGDWKFTESI